MSAFRDLLEQARAKGQTKLWFEVDLPAFFADEQSPSWSCGNELAGDNFAEAHGRTGEEALRHLVERL